MKMGTPQIIKCSKCGSTNYGYTSDMRLMCRNCGHEEGKPKKDWMQREEPKIYEHRNETVRKF